MGRERGLGCRVVEFVAHVGEEGSSGLELLDEGDGFVEVRVAGVRIAPQRIEDEDVQVLKQGEAFLGDIAHVRKIGGTAEAIAGDLLTAVQDRDTAKAGSEEIEPGSGRRVEAVDLYAGAGRIAVFGAEGVVEDAFNGFGGVVIRVDGQIAFGVKAERAQVVKAHYMICVAVCIEHRIDAPNAFAKCLRMEVWTRIDQNGAAVVGQTNGRPCATIAPVAIGRDGGGADGAHAAESRYAHRGTATEKGESRLHRLADDAWANRAWTATGRRLGCGRSG